MASLLTFALIERICSLSISMSVSRAAFFKSPVQSELLMISVSCSAMNSYENLESAGVEVLGLLVLIGERERSATMLVSEGLVIVFVHNRMIRYRRGVSS